MDSRMRQSIDPSKVLCIVMGGGGGKGLFPLTRDRATAAVPLAGNYRLVDIPISNCINSGFRQVYILTQFNSASLHRHVAQAYKFDQFGDGFVEIRAAQQTFSDSSWYQGTADAVRKNLGHFLSRNFEYALILSADQLYRADLAAMVTQHAQTGADVTIASVPVPRAQASSLGILEVDPDHRVQRFVEKPTDPAILNAFQVDSDSRAHHRIESGQDLLLASMGIYVFSRDVLKALLDNPKTDFGRDIIPGAIHSHRIFSYVYQGYWDDLGAIRPFFEANLDLVSDHPRFSFFDIAAPIFSQPLYLPGAKVNAGLIDHALLAAGCIIHQATIRHSIIGIRCPVGSGSELHRVVSLGCDYYESEQSATTHQRLGLPLIGIGRNTRIENTIIDRNARIGDDVVITPNDKPPFLDHGQYFIRDGIVIVPRNGVIPHGTVI